MKFLHLSDLHLGRRIYEQSLLEDQRDMLDKLCGIAKAQRVDAVLIAGDVYDKRVPVTDAVSLLDGFLTRLVSEGLQVFVIAGNHDSGERLQFGSGMMAKGGLHIAGSFDGTLPFVTIDDAHGPVHVWMLPFIRASMVAHYMPSADTSTYDAAVASVMAAAPVDPTARNILIAHQFVTDGGREPDQAGSESASLTVGTVDHVRAACFDAFDYVALGHIHRAQAVSRPEVRYAGSPLKYSLSEIKQDKTVPIVTLGPKGDVQIEQIPLTPLREMRRLTDTFDTLMQSPPEGHAHDYFYLTLADKVPIPDAISHLKTVYPYTLRMDYAQSAEDRALPQPDREGVRHKTLIQHFTDFYAAVTGDEPDPAQLSLIRDIEREIGGDAR